MISRVKICGITRLEDALCAIEAGADALGFVFYPPSPRYISPELAAEIIAALPPFVTSTALFVDEEAAEVTRIINMTEVDLLQFHGGEAVDYCEQFSRPYIKALRMNPSLDVEIEVNKYPSARAILLDTFVKGVPGGTGATFNWQLVPPSIQSKIILAGGLDASNVAAAIQQLHPYAVDVSGGLEAEKGLKCPQKITEFMSEVARANQN